LKSSLHTNCHFTGDDDSLRVGNFVENKLKQEMIRQKAGTTINLIKFI
jgi:hypothetical protein